MFLFFVTLIKISSASFPRLQWFAFAMDGFVIGLAFLPSVTSAHLGGNVKAEAAMRAVYLRSIPPLYSRSLTRERRED